MWRDGFVGVRGVLGERRGGGGLGGGEKTLLRLHVLLNRVLFLYTCYSYDCLR